jgi:hypothetical protein
MDISATDTRPFHRRGRKVLDATERKRAATFRLSPEAFTLIGALVDEMGLSQASIVETAIRDLATARGVRKRASTRTVKSEAS